MSAPPSQPVHGLPIPPPDAPHAGPPPPRGHYDPSWRPEQRTVPPGPLPPPYTGPPRDMTLPPPPDAPFGSSGSLSAPPSTSRTPSELAQPPPPGFRPPMNGAPPESGPPGFRPAVGYANEQNGTHPPPLPMLSTAESMSGTNVRPGQYTPTTPLPHSASYDGYFFSQAGSRPRRTQRATQACDQCRTRKARCDEGRPTCSGCKDMNLQCVYKEVPPHKHERSTQLVLEKIQEVKDDIKQVHDKLEGSQRSEDGSDDIEGRIAKILETKLDSLLKQTQNQTVPLVVKPEMETKQNTVSATPPNASAIPNYHEVKNFEAKPPDEIRSELIESRDRDLSLPIDHTTAAHKLLSWPAIQRLLPEPMDEEYVMQTEEARGPLRPYGRGEGDYHASYACSPTAGSPGSPHEEESFLTTSPWGFGLLPPPPAPQFQVGGLNPDGTLNTDKEMIWMYHDSYLRNMHILHPFLDEKGLCELMHNFVRTCGSRGSNNNSAIPPNFYQAGDGSATLPRGPKRKRSVDVSYNVSGTDDRRTACQIPMIERSVENALALLVLALGSICRWKTDIPGPVQASSCRPGSPYVSVQNSPNATHPPLHSPTESSFPPMSNQYRRFSGPHQPPWPAREPPEQPARNMHMIPGMAYYAYAADILGCHQGNSTLRYSQACLLAGLYAGQLAHPFASHGWIREASRACQVILRPRRYNKTSSFQKNLIKTTFWSCLQLESDILAELDLPDSGLNRWVEAVPQPERLASNTIADDDVHFYYLTQISIRKWLNVVHFELYNPDRDRNPQSTLLQAGPSRFEEWRQALLEDWRKSLPPNLAWDDNDPPSSDINVARMRAKYYGGKYIIHRPFLQHALNQVYPKVSNSAASPAVSIVSSSQSQASPSLTHHSEAMERRYSDMGPPSRNVSTPEQLYPHASWKNLDQKIRDGCEICIQAAMNSTIAFDGIQGRPIVTNIFGTAHAQFGNMLVLSATYMSHLWPLINREKLLELLDRTIAFLNQSRRISPTLKRDAEILGMIKNKILTSPTANTSFSSNG